MGGQKLEDFPINQLRLMLAATEKSAGPCSSSAALIRRTIKDAEANQLRPLIKVVVCEVLESIRDQQHPSNDLLPIGPMARRLRVNVGWLSDEADAGRVPCLKAGKRYLFAPEAVERVLAERASQCVTSKGTTL